MSDPEHPAFARLYDPVMALPERTILRPHREYLTDNLSGRVLDLGAGTGALFPYFAATPNAIRSLHAIEPDPHMREQARECARNHNLTVELSDAGAEELPYDDGVFDIVVASFVFCTIPEFDRALSEVSRVLKDEGEFRYVEHVRADGLAGRLQDLLAPAWHAVAGGCHLNRRTDERFLRDDRFRAVEFSRHDEGLSGLFPTVRGTLERKQSRSLLERVLG